MEDIGIKIGIDSKEALQAAAAFEKKAVSSFEKMRKSSISSFEKIRQKAVSTFSNMAKRIFSLQGALVGLIGTAGFGGVLKVAADLERGMLGVQKTTGLSSKTINELRKEFIGLTKIMPVSAAELAGIGEVAGQLGIQGKKNILEFTKVISMIAITTNMTAEEAATAMAQITNVMGEPISNTMRLGAVMNELSNTTVATAADIADLTLRMGTQAKMLGLTSAETMAFSASIRDIGVSAEAGGTALGNIFIKMMSDTERLAKAAKLDFKTFQKAVADDPIRAVKMLIEQIGKLGKMEAATAFNEMGLAGKRTVTVLGGLANNFKMVEKNLKTANEEWRVATSLQKEYDIFIKGTWNQLKLLKNQIVSVALALGNDMLPVTKELIENIKNDFIPNLESLGQYFRDNKEAVMEMVREGYEQFVTVGSRVIEVFKNMKTPATLVFSAIGSFAEAMANNTLVMSGAGLLGYALFGPAGAFAAMAIITGINEIAKATAFFFEELGNATKPKNEIEALRRELDLLKQAAEKNLSSTQMQQLAAAFPIALSNAKSLNDRIQTLQIRILQLTNGVGDFATTATDIDKVRKAFEEAGLAAESSVLKLINDSKKLSEGLGSSNKESAENAAIVWKISLKDMDKSWQRHYGRLIKLDAREAARQAAYSTRMEKEHQDLLNKKHSIIEKFSLVSIKTFQGELAYKKAIRVKALNEEIQQYRFAGVQETKILAYEKAAQGSILKQFEDEKKKQAGYYTQFNLAQLQRMLKDTATVESEKQRIIGEVNQRVLEGKIGHWEALKLGWDDVTGNMRGKFQSTAQYILDEGGKLAGDLHTALSDTFYNSFSGKLGDIAEVWDTFKKKIWDDFKRLIADVASKTIIMGFKAMWDGNPSGQGPIEKMLGFDVPFLTFAGGGDVPGTWNGIRGKKGDTVAGWLTPGEYVMDRETTQSPFGKWVRSVIEGGKKEESHFAGGEVPHMFLGGLFKGIGSAISGIVGGIGDLFSGFSKWVSDSDIGKIITIAATVAAIGLTGGAAGFLASPLLMPALSGAAIGGGMSLISGGDILSGMITGGALAAATAGVGQMFNPTQAVMVGGNAQFVPKSELTWAAEGGRGIWSSPTGDIMVRMPPSSAQFAKSLGSQAFQGVADMPSQAWDSIKQMASKPWDDVKSMLQGQGISKDTFEKFKSLPSSVWDSLKSAPGNALDAVREGFTPDGAMSYIKNNSESMMSHFMLQAAGGKTGLAGYDWMGGMPKMAFATAHTGVDYVPHKNMPFILDQGERVLSNNDNRAMTGTLERVEVLLQKITNQNDKIIDAIDQSGGDVHLTIQGEDGRVLIEKTLDELKWHSKHRGVIHAEGVIVYNG